MKMLILILNPAARPVPQMPPVSSTFTIALTATLARLLVLAILALLKSMAAMKYRMLADGLLSALRIYRGMELARR